MRNQAEDKYTIHTSIDNDTAELARMTCIDCGASLELVDKTHARCPYCKQTYVIDEARGVAVNVNVDYGDSAEVQKTVKKTQHLLIGFLIAAAVIALFILGYNIAANRSLLSSSDSDAPIQEQGNLLVIFCKDIFDKEYRKITPEEFASIRYIKYDYKRDGDSNDHYHVVYYSFTNYEDCESEEEFLDTVRSWTYEDSKANWPSDFSMLTGLTRIDTTDSTWMSLLQFSPDCKISYVASDDSLEIISSKVNPEYVSVLDLGAFSDNLNGLEQYENLEVLKAKNAHLYTTTNLSGIKKCSKLKELYLSCADTYEGVDEIAELSELKSLYMNGVTLSQCDFLKKIPQLEELSMQVGEDADLSILTYLPNLRKFDTIMDADGVSIDQLSVLTKLESLRVTVNNKEDFLRLAQLKNLKSLRVYASFEEMDERYHYLPIDISVFSQLTQLEQLQIRVSNMGGICGVESILNMPTIKTFAIEAVIPGKKLWLDTELLVDNPNLATFCMKDLSVGDVVTKEEETFDFLSHYPNMNELWLASSDLTDISFVSALTNLERCDFEDNDITDYSPLSNCKKLEYLCVGLFGSNAVPDMPKDVEVVQDVHWFNIEL